LFIYLCFPFLYFFDLPFSPSRRQLGKFINHVLFDFCLILIYCSPSRLNFTVFHTHIFIYTYTRRTTKGGYFPEIKPSSSPSKFGARNVSSICEEWLS
jgi:hypothetical protein